MRDDRRFILAYDLDIEQISAADRVAEAVAIVGGDREDRIIAAIIGPRRDTDHAGSIAIVGQRDEARHWPERAFVHQAEDQRITVGVAAADRDLDNLVLGDGDVLDRLHERAGGLVEPRDRASAGWGKRVSVRVE